MKSYLYRLRCLTNLHVGSGEANFNIVDKEVETDPVNGLPIIHASGFKGALRDDCGSRGMTSDVVDKAFGKAGSDTDGASGGRLRFMDAHLLYRPMRAAGPLPSMPVTTLPILREYLGLIEAFGCSPYGEASLPELSFGENRFLSCVGGAKIEGDATGQLAEPAQISAVQRLLGLEKKEFAVAKSFDGYDLPVIARNNVQPDHRNLWYEEFVPHGSCFYLVALAPDGDEELVNQALPDGHILQVGGNASVGYGYCKLERLSEGSI